MKAVALLGGPKAEWPQNLRQKLLHAQEMGQLLVGVDRGSLLLLELGLKPDLAIGDFDSLKAAELGELEKNCPDIRYSVPEKDDTDSELMVKTVFKAYQVQSLTIYGATGGRLDHYLINLMMFLAPGMRPFAEKVRICDRQNEIRFFNPGKHEIERLSDFPYIGIWNLEAVQNLNIIGAKYELRHFNSSYPIMRASNEFNPGSSSFTLTSDQGMLAAVYSRDLKKYDNI